MTPRRSLAPALPALLLALATGGAWADCFRLYDKAEQVIYQGYQPPFDIAYDPAAGPSVALRESRARGERLEILAESCPPPEAPLLGTDTAGALPRTDDERAPRTR